MNIALACDAEHGGDDLQAGQLGPLAAEPAGCSVLHPLRFNCSTTASGTFTIRTSTATSCAGAGCEALAQPINDAAITTFQKREFIRASPIKKRPGSIRCQTAYD